MQTDVKVFWGAQLHPPTCTLNITPDTVAKPGFSVVV